MHTVTSAASLRDAIRVLEETRAVQEKELKYQFEETLESLKPKNIARTTVARITDSPRVRHSLISGAMSLLTGWLSKRVIFGSSRRGFRGFTGRILQFGVTTIMAKYREEIEAGLRDFLLRLLSRDDRVRVQQI